MLGTLAAMFTLQLALQGLDPTLDGDRGLRGLAFGIFPTVVTAIGLAFRARHRGISLRDMGFVRPRTWRPVALAFVVATFAGPLTAWGSSLTGAVGLPLPDAAGSAPEVINLARLGVGGILTLAVTLSLIVPLGEELIFRGLVHRSIRARWPLFPSALLSATLFAAVHLDPAALLPLFIVGFILAWSYERSGSLWGSIVPHGGLNALTVLVALTGR